MMKAMRVIAVNKPHGTMTVQWDDDAELEWNYTIPMDDNGVPLKGDPLLRFLISESYDMVGSIKDAREEHLKRGLVDFSQHDKMLRMRFNVEDMVREYEAALSITG